MFNLNRNTNINSYFIVPLYLTVKTNDALKLDPAKANNCPYISNYLTSIT